MSDNGNGQVQSAETAEAAVDTAGPASGGRKRRKVRVGVVVSDKANKTIVVKVERKLPHPLYGKLVAQTKKYHVHDENNEYKVGDTVRIAETRPLSKTKRWRAVGLVDRPA
jgi:small subunit ribosomal protein S17